MILHAPKLVIHIIAPTTHSTQDHSAHIQMIMYQQLDSLADSLFTSDTSTQCAFNIIPSNLEEENDKLTEEILQNNTGFIFIQNINTFGDAHV